MFYQDKRETEIRIWGRRRRPEIGSGETIKKFILLPRDFSVDGGELTPTLKLKRKIIYSKYQDRIEKLYLHNGNGSDDYPQIENGGHS